MLANSRANMFILLVEFYLMSEAVVFLSFFKLLIDKKSCLLIDICKFIVFFYFFGRLIEKKCM